MNQPSSSLNGDLVLANGKIFLKQRGLVAADVLVKDGKIRAIGNSKDWTSARQLDLKNLVVLPGLIDSQVHFREPGNEHKEDLATGTKAAVLGGITTVFEMPNTNPPTVSPELLKDKIKRAEGRVHSHIGFYLGATHENVEQLADWETSRGCVGVKVFMGSSTGNLLLDRPEDLIRLLKKGRRRVTVHCEDQQRLEQRKKQLSLEGNVALHPVWRDEQTALIATQRLIRSAEETGRPVHVLHVTSQEEMEFLKDHKSICTVETTPQHLTFSAPECYERLGTLAQMNPPIREERHRLAIWKALNAGVVDILGSDHAPHTLEEKSKTYPASPSGMTGVQTMACLMLDHVQKGHLTLDRFVELLSEAPARAFGAKNKGAIQIGNDADFSIFDLNRTEEITNKWIASRCGWTPFDGVKVTGWPVGTIVGGHLAMWEGATESPQGQIVEFD